MIKIDKISLAKKYNIPLDSLIQRGDGRIEWICSHGIGHTVWFPKGLNDVHGCDGCCKALHKERK